MKKIFLIFLVSFGISHSAISEESKFNFDSCNEQFGSELKKNNKYRDYILRSGTLIYVLASFSGSSGRTIGNRLILPIMGGLFAENLIRKGNLLEEKSKCLSDKISQMNTNQ